MSIANELITRGWTKGSWGREDGSVCLEGAMSLCGISRGSEVVKRIVADLYEPGDDYTTGSDGLPILFSFNDRSHRTFDDVLRVAKYADEMLDAQ